VAVVVLDSVMQTMALVLEASGEVAAVEFKIMTIPEWRELPTLVVVAAAEPELADQVKMALLAAAE